MDELEALHLACAFDLKVPERRQPEVQALISMINEQLWIGHFDVWSQQGLVMFRHALVLAGGSKPPASSASRCCRPRSIACERYFTAFQFVVWAGKGARRRSPPPCSRPRARRDAST